MGTLRNFLDGQNHQHLTKLNDFWRAEEKSTHNDKFIVTPQRLHLSKTHHPSTLINGLIEVSILVYLVIIAKQHSSVAHEIFV